MPVCKSPAHRKRKNSLCSQLSNQAQKVIVEIDTRVVDGIDLLGAIALSPKAECGIGALQEKPSTGIMQDIPKDVLDFLGGCVVYSEEAMEESCQPLGKKFRGIHD